MGSSRHLDLKYKLALKAIGLGPKDPVYRAVQTFVPLLGLATIKAVTVQATSDLAYLDALDALEIPNDKRYAGGILARSVTIEFEDVSITLEQPTKASSWKHISK